MRNGELRNGEIIMVFIVTMYVYMDDYNGLQWIILVYNRLQWNLMDYKYIYIHVYSDDGL